ncbi:molybdopterin-dependent oxidoreductase [Runella sp.]|uniref:molybdopterin-dependent oxidoreductase n=1 Tax=Runella sp. TaxID=1960881 RepID=UPI003D0CF8F6
MNGTSSYKTTCCYCGVGCGVVVSKTRNGRISVEGDPGHPSSKGMLCSKGRNLHYTVMDTTDRLLYPQMRHNRQSALQRVSWDTALERAAAVFKTFIEKYGPDSVGFYASGQCLTEEYYVVNKLIKGFIGSNNLDTNSRLCMSSAVVGYKMALGEDSVPCSYEDIELADCFLIAGSNPAWNHPIVFRRMEAHKAANPRVKFIVVDPRRTDTARMADLHLQVKPGTDVVLLNAIAKGLISRGYIDEHFIRNYTEGFDVYRVQVAERDMREAAKICGISLHDIHQAVEYIGKAKGFISMWAMGFNQSVIGVNKNLALLNLHLITGHIGKAGSGPFSLTGQPNAMGGREVGGLSNLLPAHRNLADPTHRQEVADFWGVPSLNPKPGLTATEMFQALKDGRMKAIWIMCTNPLVSLPNVHLVEEALQAAKFVVVQDISNRSDTLAYADLVLPAAAWGEKTGTMTNSERRVSYLNQFMEPVGEALPDSEIIVKFAHKMGFGHAFNYQNAAEIYDEHVRLTKGTNVDISGLSHERLRTQGTFQWPVPTAQSNGTPRLFGDHQFYTPSRKAQIKAVPDSNQSESLSEAFPLVLTTGRIRDQWHTMTKTGKVNKLNQHIPKAFLEINPLDAAERGIKEGNIVTIQNPRGQVQVPAKITTDIRQGVVFLPMHWGKILQKNAVRANNITNDLVDPYSKEPDFKYSAVEVQKFKKPKERIIIIGAGAAAYTFVTSHRRHNLIDEIHVFSKEPFAFYNRVMLPDYISGAMRWEKLLKMQDDERALVHLHEAVSIEYIDRERKTVRDSQGNTHSYDRLIIATGSRAATPRDYDVSLEGVFTMRTRQDADGLMRYLDINHLTPNEKPKHIAVVGGGLLGLELAASLRHIGHRATVIHRASRLMNRQLDATASALLHEELKDRNIDIYYNDEVKYLTGENNKITGVRLTSGQVIVCDAVVFTIGTTPNVEIARKAGLDVQRGVVVNAYLQTSDPSIFAIGEVAEFEGQQFGITAAAEEQAEALCAYFNGDIQSYYRPTISMNILKMEGLELCSLGMTEIPANGAGAEYEEVLFMDKQKRYYKKCIIHGDKLVGAILLGDKSEFVEFKSLIQHQTELSEKRLKLLRSGKSAPALKGKPVCSCNNVGDGNIREAIAGGCTDFQVLCQQTGAGTGCGSCRPEVKAMLQKSLEKSGEKIQK